ncbi:hypothetical protein BKA69DRAFT_224966 [Paraphysoderma sedebokerense]|nr:hypothetical protein BKA69DRAFT_224966 [Paraphysoderma sedebokerense]
MSHSSFTHSSRPCINHFVPSFHPSLHRHIFRRPHSLSRCPRQATACRQYATHSYSHPHIPSCIRLLLPNDPYKILNIPSSASTDDIKSSYRSLIFELHPDRNRNNTDTDPDELRKQFDLVKLAYEVLSVDTNRRLYDRLKLGNPSFGPSSSSSPFSNSSSPYDSYSQPYDPSYNPYYPQSSGTPFVSNYLIALGVLMFMGVGTILQFYRFESHKARVQSVLSRQNLNAWQSYKEARENANGRSKEEHFKILEDHGKRWREIKERHERKQLESGE